MDRQAYIMWGPRANLGFTLMMCSEKRVLFPAFLQRYGDVRKAGAIQAVRPIDAEIVRLGAKVPDRERTRRRRYRGERHKVHSVG